jgi:hypothetical protein
MEEFSTTSRSLMRWLRDSIASMDHRNLPNNMNEIKVHTLFSSRFIHSHFSFKYSHLKAILNDVKSFRLEEYAIRLREKKRLIQLRNELSVSQNKENRMKCKKKKSIHF